MTDESLPVPRIRQAPKRWARAEFIFLMFLALMTFFFEDPLNLTIDSHAGQAPQTDEYGGFSVLIQSKTVDEMIYSEGR